ncbi:MAG: transcription antitermination factor NusB [Chitinophagaceae bacterium]|nr:transcription antitermination factor NusB [Chitinophagaceae bacterium]
MLSRRNIRVKVMQTLYSMESTDFSTEEAGKVLENKIENTQELLTYIFDFLLSVCKYSDTYADQKAHKHLPTSEDLSVSVKIAENTLVTDVSNNPTFIKAVKKFKTENLIDINLVRKSFMDLIETETYKEYIAAPGREKVEEKKIIEFILDTAMLDNEDFNSDGEERFIYWDADMDAAIPLIKRVLSKPEATDFLELPDQQKMNFAHELLKTVQDKNDVLLELIKPKLKNWEADRIAVLDMILLKMGLSELMYFETIPTKVTLNEYIEIAKEYSTPKSGHFVNGILDNLLKDLEGQDKIHKKNFKGITN